MVKDVMKKCKCQTCGVEARSIPGTRHRRCSGIDNHTTLRAKSKKVTIEERGFWA